MNKKIFVQFLKEIAKSVFGCLGCLSILVIIIATGAWLIEVFKRTLINIFTTDAISNFSSKATTVLVMIFFVAFLYAIISESYYEARKKVESEESNE